MVDDDDYDVNDGNYDNDINSGGARSSGSSNGGGVFVVF